jgi:Lar family restriction alleviation protein
MKTIQISDETYEEMQEQIDDDQTLLKEQIEQTGTAYGKWAKDVKMPPGEIKLKVCPFCGAKPHLHEQTTVEGIAFFVWCENCHAQGPGHELRKRCKVLWNERRGSE